MVMPRTLHILFRIAIFIKQRLLYNRIGNNIPQISKFGFATWELIIAIYESGWDKLMAKNNNKNFQQCISS